MALPADQGLGNEFVVGIPGLGELESLVQIAFRLPPSGVMSERERVVTGVDGCGSARRIELPRRLHARRADTANAPPRQVVATGDRAAVACLGQDAAERVAGEFQDGVAVGGADETTQGVINEPGPLFGSGLFDDVAQHVVDVMRRLTDAVDALDQLAGRVIAVPQRTAIEVGFVDQVPGRVVFVQPHQALRVGR